MDAETREFWQEVNERGDRGDRLTIELTPREAVYLGHLLRLALRDGDVKGLWKSTALAADIRERIDNFLSETPVLARHVKEMREWERKYEPALHK